MAKAATLSAANAKQSIKPTDVDKVAARAKANGKAKAEDNPKPENKPKEAAAKGAAVKKRKKKKKSSKSNSNQSNGTATKEKGSEKPKTGTQKKKKKEGKWKKRGRRGGRQIESAPKLPPAPKKSTKTRTFPIIKEDLQLDHTITRNGFDTHFDGFRTAFFHSTAILGRFGLNTGTDEVHQYVIGLIENLDAEIEAETQRLSALIKSKGGPTNIPRSSPNKEMRKAEVPSFVVRKYLGMFKKVDRLVDAIVCAENVGAVSWNRRHELMKKANSYLRSPAGRYISLAQKLLVRERWNNKNSSAAKQAMVSVLHDTLERQKSIDGMEKKRPMKSSKAAG